MNFKGIIVSFTVGVIFCSVITYFRIWGITSTVIYSLFTTAYFCVSFLGFFIIKDKPNNFTDYASISIPLSKLKGFKKVKLYTSLFFTIIVKAISWPVSLYFELKSLRLKTVQNGAIHTLNPVDNYILLYKFIIIVSIFIIFIYTNLFSLFSFGITVLIIISTAIYLLSILIDGNTLQEKYKRSDKNIPLNLIFNGFIIFSTLVFSMALVKMQSTKNSDISFKSLFELSKQLFDYKNIALAIINKPLDIIWLDLSLGILGLLFALSVFSTLKNLKSYKRMPDDILSIVHTMYFLGDFSEAKKWLTKIDINDKNFKYRTIESVILISEGKFDKALYNYKTTNSDIEDQKLLTSYGFVMCYAQIKAYELSNDLAIKLFKVWFKNENYSEAYFGYIFYTHIFFSFFTLNSNFFELLEKDEEISTFEKNKVIDVIFDIFSTEQENIEQTENLLLQLNEVQVLKSEIFIIEYLKIIFFVVLKQKINSIIQIEDYKNRLNLFFDNIIGLSTTFEQNLVFEMLLGLQALSNNLGNEYDLSLDERFEDILKNLPNNMTKNEFLNAAKSLEFMTNKIFDDNQNSQY